MSVFDTIRIAASGLTAERLRMDVAASNIANAQTTQTQNGVAGQPYQEEEVVFQSQQMGPMAAAQGVTATAIVTSTQPYSRVYDPTNPDADQTGFVNYPNVNVASRDDGHDGGRSLLPGQRDRGPGGQAAGPRRHRSGQGVIAR